MFKILLADDNVSNTMILQDVIQSWGDYDVLVANDGTKALDMIQTELPDLVFLDIMMPGLSGFEVCRQIKENPSTMDIPIILLSALSEEEDRIHGFNVGANLFLPKPVSHAELKAVVERGIRRNVRVMTQEPMANLVAFMSSMIVSAKADNHLSENLINSEVNYCAKLAKQFKVEGRLADMLCQAIKVQDWYAFLRKISGDDQLIEEFCKLRIAHRLKPILDGKLEEEATLEGRIFSAVTGYGQLYLEHNENVNDALTALRREALAGKYDLEIVNALDSIVRAENILRNL